MKDEFYKIEFYKSHMDDGHEFELDFDKDLSEQNLLYPTRCILANLFRDYIATEEDRAEILKEGGKNILTIDLNPLSRTSKMSDVSIMDNIVRAIPFMTKIAEDLKTQDKAVLYELVNEFDNEENLKESLEQIKVKE